MSTNKRTEDVLDQPVKVARKTLPNSRKPKKRKRYQAWLIKKLIVLFSWLPLRVNQALGRGVGRLLWWISNDNKRNTLINIKIAFPEKSEVERQDLAKESLLHLGMMATELGPTWMWTEEKLMSLVKDVKGQHYLDEVLAKVNVSGVLEGSSKDEQKKQNKGIIFLSPHIGAWELLGSFLSIHYPATFLYSPAKIEGMEGFMLRSRQRFGAELVPTDMRGIRTLMQALKSGRVTGVLPDQDAGDKGGIHTPFFGHPARTMTLVSKLIQKTDCEFIFVVFERLPKAQGFRVHYLPADPGMASKDEEVATLALNRGVEACVSIMPEQYLWSYRRFRKPPKGYENPYK